MHEMDSEPGVNLMAWEHWTDPSESVLHPGGGKPYTHPSSHGVYSTIESSKYFRANAMWKDGWNRL